MVVTFVRTAVVWAALGGVLAAQAPGTLKGVVVDASGGAIANARVTLRDQAGSAIRSTTADAGGRFVMDAPASTYVLVAESDLFETRREDVRLSEGGVHEIRLALAVAGLAESLVVTGRRLESRLSETPQTIDVVTREDIERTVAVDVTDVLKKNAGVDVVQYTGMLSGVGMRGFRPEFSGINKRSLLLIDGRPSGVTNLATLLLDNVERIEVMKGPASAIYGASAMGGVINVITRHSRGPAAGSLRLEGGSFATSDIGGRAGGSVTPRIDFDGSVDARRQAGDLRLGGGEVRPFTGYSVYDGWARLGADLFSAWRLDGRVNVYRARDVETPGDIASGLNSQGRKNMDRSTVDIRLRGQARAHALSVTGYTAREASSLDNVTSLVPADQAFLPYLSFESELGWVGAQLQDAWAWGPRASLVLGLDYERVESESRSYQRTGTRQGPFSADSHQTTTAGYAENRWRLRDGATIVSAGGRFDRIGTETRDTPFKLNFTPSRTVFHVFSPSIGLKHALTPSLRLHATAGRAFVPPAPSALTGFTESTVGGRTQITQGNPDLQPERSASVDAGLELSSRSVRLDATYFQTWVSDRVVSSVVISKPAPPAPVIVSFANALGSRMRGLEVDYQHRLGAPVGVFAGLTHFFTRREELAAGERNILNVAAATLRAGVDLRRGPVNGRAAVRYVHGRQDNDFTLPGAPVIDYPDFAIVDATAAYTITGRHSVSVVMNNLFDELYYEKKGYPHAGRAFTLTYRLDIR